MKPSFTALVSTLLIVGCFAADPTPPKTKTASSMDSEKPLVVKSESEWKKKLTESIIKKFRFGSK